jgi:DNA adenine methylase
MHTNAIEINAGVNGATPRSLRPVSAPFGYYGSKQRLASKIVAKLPPHNAWVEAFCGSAALTLAKKPAPIEVLNDINGEIVNFFHVLRDDSSELCRLLSLTPYARQELHEARLKADDLSDVERARRFFVAAMMAINGAFGKDKGGFSFSNSYSRRGMEARVSRWNAMPDHLMAVAERLKLARIENKDAIKLLNEFSDRPATLVYLDPPYLADREHGYDHDEKTEEFHERLLKNVTRAKCMVLLSGYENELYQDYLTKNRGWHRRTTKTTTRGHNGKDSQREEIVWFNEQYRTARQAKRIPVHLSKQEREYGKINPRRATRGAI